MKIRLERARTLDWSTGNLYIIPTLRLYWGKKMNGYNFTKERFEDRRTVDFSIVWLSGRLVFEFTIVKYERKSNK